jgi:hypothetical protein
MATSVSQTVIRAKTRGTETDSWMTKKGLEAGNRKSEKEFKVKTSGAKREREATLKVTFSTSEDA